MNDPDHDVVRAMTACLTHRGPDSEGFWSDAGGSDEGGVVFGHRRLRVVDLAPTGHQPMTSPSGRYVLSYNGEIYNHLELRQELSSSTAFRGTSDTEVLLAAIDAWGLERTLQQSNGMFAFALWDRADRQLCLVRDRLGIKPLYYAHDGSRLAFASELAALRLVPWVDLSLDHPALTHYFRFLAVPAPFTVHRGVRKLLPGEIVVANRVGGIDRRRWWTLDRAIASGRATPSAPGDVADALDALVRDAVGIRLRADVEVGTLLSGGIDSTLVTAVAAEVSSRPIKSFTIGFDEESHDESLRARATADHLGLEHVIERFSSGDALRALNEVISIHDEPFADVGSLPFLLLSRMARRSVTVALSGDGGDELFGGYPRYFWAERIRAVRNRLGPAAVPIGEALARSPERLLDGPIDRLTRGRLSGTAGLAARVRRFGGYLAGEPAMVYEDMLSVWPDAERLVGLIDASRPEKLNLDARWPGLAWAEQMMAVDQETYLPDDILTKVDRVSMSTALEVRVPLLDYRIVEFSWRLPLETKLAARGDRGKLPLRALLRRRVPEHLLDRPKMGFGVPLATWLRGPLRDWADERLSQSEIQADGVLDPDLVHSAWSGLLAGDDARERQVWTVLAFIAWRDAVGRQTVSWRGLGHDR